MRVLCLSEHFQPRIGGTVRYVYQTCSALQAHGLEVTLLVPGPRPNTSDLNEFPFRVCWIDAGYPERGDPPRARRYEFCQAVNREVQEIAKAGGADVVHVLFGLFLLEELDTAGLAHAGVPSVATVHNLPPMECARSFEGDAWVKRAIDGLRLRIVAWKNDTRLRRRSYSTYVAPSPQVGAQLSKVLSGAAVEVIGHGVTDDLVTRMHPPLSRRPERGAPVQLLTLGGWAPHKRQHLIPEIAHRLHAAGLDFRWTVAGPAGRVVGYKDAVDQALASRGLVELVRTHDAVPLDDLAALYDAAHLYVQPSTEEGFCITALDAAAAGLPVIGSPAGALPKICEASGGRLVPSQARAIAEAIDDFVENNCWVDDATTIAETVREGFTWQHAAGELADCYARCASPAGVQRAEWPACNGTCEASPTKS